MINIDKNEILEKAKNVIEERKLKAETIALNYEQILLNDPLYINACNRNAKARLQFIQKNLKNEANENLKDEVIKSQEAINQVMALHNITKDMIKPNYSCKICNDTGYKDGKICICLKNIYNKLLIKESNIDFDNIPYLEDIDTSYYHNNNTIKGISLLKKIVQKFDETKINIIMLVGGCGTGKTYVMKSFSKSLLENGKTILYLTAFALNNLIKEMTFGDYNTQKQIQNQLLDVDLLVIDDLGTEQILRNVTVENLYTIIDERINRNKKIILSTNLTPNNIIQRYNERIYSRLFHKNLSLHIAFDDYDIRQRS